MFILDMFFKVLLLIKHILCSLNTIYTEIK